MLLKNYIRMKSHPFVGRRKIIELLVDRVMLSHDTIEICYAIPLTGLAPADRKGTLRMPYRTLS